MKIRIDSAYILYSKKNKSFISADLYLHETFNYDKATKFRYLEDAKKTLKSISSSITDHKSFSVGYIDVTMELQD